MPFVAKPLTQAEREYLDAFDRWLLNPTSDSLDHRADALIRLLAGRGVRRPRTRNRSQFTYRCK